MTNTPPLIESRPLLSLILTRVLPVLVLAVIFWGTLAPQDPMPKYFPGQDKLEHLIAFMLLGAVLTLAVSRRMLVIVAGFCAIMSIGVEFGQAWLTLHREPSIRDAAASLLGSALGLGAGSAVRTYVWSRVLAFARC